MRVRAMTDLALAGKRVLIREDLNVPIKKGVVTSDARIVAALPTLERALAAGAAVMVVSHLGRPTEGADANERTGVQSRARGGAARGVVETQVPLVGHWIDGVDIAPGQIKLLENVRWIEGEGADDDALARRMAQLCDVFVMDAFGTAHRAQVSTHGIAKYAPTACAGPLLAAELDALGSCAREPVATDAGGGGRFEGVDQARSAGPPRRKSPMRSSSVAASPTRSSRRRVTVSANRCTKRTCSTRPARSRKKVEIPMPVDVMTAPNLDESAPATLRLIDDVRPDEMILDIGPETARRFAQAARRRRHRFCGTGRSVYSSSISSAKARACWPKPLPKAPHFRSPAAVIRWRRSTNTESPTEFRTSPPAAAHSWNSWKENGFRLSKYSKTRARVN